MRYLLERSQENPDWWVLTDTENLIVCKFKEHLFNETQRITILEESKFTNNAKCADELAKIMSDMGDYIFSHWYSIAFPTPVFEFREDEKKGKLLLIRNKYPKFCIDIQDDCDLKQLSDALKAAGEFVLKCNNKK